MGSQNSKSSTDGGSTKSDEVHAQASHGTASKHHRLRSIPDRLGAALSKVKGHGPVAAQSNRNSVAGLSMKSGSGGETVVGGGSGSGLGKNKDKDKDKRASADVDHTTTAVEDNVAIQVEQDKTEESRQQPQTQLQHQHRQSRNYAAAPPSFIMPPQPVPCQYRTGKTLGSGTYAIVKEAIHIKTGQYYACKVINKKLMEGREHMVRNEIAVLKRISSGNRNIVTLHDYFETAHNLYLCFDLCTGGELFDRICAKGNYYEVDAATLVRTIMQAVKHIHDANIVHRDLKPENLLFRDINEDADIMVADFGLSRIMEDEKLTKLTEICGTPGYMAPEIFLRTGHGKPVDVWAMGVITYFLLAGYTPFDRDTQQAEMEAIIAGDYKFEPEEYWENVSETAKDFVRALLTVDPAKRLTAAQALQHKWLRERKEGDEAVGVVGSDGQRVDLLPHVKINRSNAKKLWRKATVTVKAMNRMAALAGVHMSEAAQLKEDVDAMKLESEKEDFENAPITHQYHDDAGHTAASAPSSPISPTHRKIDGIAATLQNARLNDYQP